MFVEWVIEDTNSVWQSSLGGWAIVAHIHVRCERLCELKCGSWHCAVRPA